MKRKILLIVSVLVLAACAPQPATPTPDISRIATETAAAFVTATPLVPVTPTTTTEPLPVPPDIATQTAAAAGGTPQGEPQFLAYIQNGHLLVTDVTNGVKGGTTQYTVAGQSDQVTDLVWSPSGEYVAFVSAATGTPHIFYIFALGQSSPTDLGPGSAPAWSPDSTSIAFIGGAYPNENISVTTIDNPSPRPLTTESNYAWGRPAFTPDGTALVVAGADRNNMGAQGNTTFLLESLTLDGSGARQPLPGSIPLEGMRLPYDLRLSPDGSRLAFSSSSHWSACASPGAYFISNPDGSNLQELVSPSLLPAIDNTQERFHVGLSYAWRPAGDGIVALGNVIDCKMDSPTMGQVIAGPQMSSIGLDGSEGLVIPGFFYGISMDRGGTMIAAARFLEGFADLNPTVEIFSTQSGQPILSLGPGSNPQFQP